MEINHILLSIRERTFSDFSAIALLCSPESTREMDWKFVSGNISTRYKKMKTFIGRGITGLVMQTGRPVVWDNQIPNIEHKRFQSAIMVGENLIAAAAVPIKSENAIQGVLLIGCRSLRCYNKEDLNMLAEAAKKLAMTEIIQ